MGDGSGWAWFAKRTESVRMIPTSSMIIDCLGWREALLPATRDDYKAWWLRGWSGSGDSGRRDDMVMGN